METHVLTVVFQTKGAQKGQGMGNPFPMERIP